MKFKISVDEVWPVFAIDKIDTSGQYNQYEIEITEDFYSQYIALMTKYSILQQQLRLIYDNTVPRGQCEYSFPKGSKVEQHTFNKIIEPS